MRGDGVKLCGQLADEDVGELRAARDCGDAALRFEARGGDAAIFDADGQTEDVTADGICHFDCGGGVGQVAGIMRGAKVVEDDFVERCTRCCTQAPTPL